MNLPKIFQVRTFRRFARRKWYIFLISFVAGLDIFIFMIPTEAILVSSVMLTPRKWVSRFVWVSIGSSLGALLLASLIQVFGPEMIHAWIGEKVGQSTWGTLTNLMHQSPFLGVFLFALGPFPHQAGIILAMLSGGTLPAVFFGTLLGRGIKYGAFAWMGSHAPKALPGFKGLEATSGKKKTRATPTDR